MLKAMRKSFWSYSILEFTLQWEVW